MLPSDCLNAPGPTLGRHADGGGLEPPATVQGTDPEPTADGGPGNVRAGVLTAEQAAAPVGTTAHLQTGPS